MSLSLVRTLFTKRRSVRDDWISWLPPDKITLFKSISTRWDRALNISGIALQEAFELRRHGKFEQAYLHVQITSELVARNAAELTRAMRLMNSEARHVGNLPTVEPLNSAYFYGESAKEVAHWNTFFHWVLFDSRTQFFQKLRVLENVIDDTASYFAALADELLDPQTDDLDANWQMLACLECDLNTCARELEVVLKGLLRNLPVTSVATLREGLEAPLPLTAAKARARKSRVAS